jgi:tetratricopeptide (TPR) repeat protein
MLWPDAIVEENNLNQYVSALRKVLNNGDAGEHYIETVRRYGYRFTADVRETSDESHALLVYKHSRTHVLLKEEQVEETTAVTDFVDPPPSNTRRRLLVGAAAIALVAVVTGVVMIGWYLPTAASRNRIDSKPATLTENSAARQDYLTGRAAWNKRTSAGLFESIEHFERAIEKDPQFALGYAGLADAYAFDFRNWRKAEALARKALEMDSSLAEPHATLGFIRTFWEWNREEGEKEFRLATKLKPTYATAHQWYAIHLAVTGRSLEAQVEMVKALELEPHSPVMLADMGQILYFNHKPEEAIKFCRQALEIDPNFVNAHRYLYEISVTDGDPREALREFAILRKFSADPGPAPDEERLVRVYQREGRKGFWREMLAFRQNDYYDAARYYALLGQVNNATQQLQRSLELRDLSIVFSTADPAFDSLHYELKFQKLMSQMGLSTWPWLQGEPIH